MFEEQVLGDSSEKSFVAVGNHIRSMRENRGWSLQDIATQLQITSEEQTIVESGSLDNSSNIINRELKLLNKNTAYLGDDTLRIEGGRELHGEINVNTSKNGAMGLLCASLLNKGTTVLHRIPRIEEVDRMLEVFESIGVRCRWLNSYENSLEIKPPLEFKLSDINHESASRTRSILMIIGALIHHVDTMIIPHASGCNLGTRTICDHRDGLDAFGVTIEDRKEQIRDDLYQESFYINCNNLQPASYEFAEQGDTSTENIIIAAAGMPGTTYLYGVSSNYMVREVCYFLEELGVKIEGIGTHNLVIHGLVDENGKLDINQDIEYHNSEDPIEAFTLIAIGVITSSAIKVNRCPKEYVRYELNMLKKMGLKFTYSHTYKSYNGKTDLVDVQLEKSELEALDIEIKPKTYPGVNPDSAPFFVAIASQAKGSSIYHDWMFNGRNQHLLKLKELGVKIKPIDNEHKLEIIGRTTLQAAIIKSPDALRPTAILLAAMMGAKGVSHLLDTYQLRRGYEDLPARLNELGASIHWADEDEVKPNLSVV
jgi:UDP-N-acetylglucosamine 1-carboxyvinyltransferase